MKVFDRSRLRLLPLFERRHDLDVSCVMGLDTDPGFSHAGLEETARRIQAARDSGAAVMMFIGGHVLRSGTQRFIIDLMRRGLVTLLAMNGAVMIHDFELALIGATTESVAKYISEGQFGLWRETGKINDIVNEGAAQGKGLGAAVGQAVLEGDFPHKDISLLAQAFECGVPATVHVGIGMDIIHEHPNFDPAATGAASYTDFLRFTEEILRLDGGVVMNFGSAVAGPEIYLKALAMARNAAHQEGRAIRDFTSLVCDLRPLTDDTSKEPPKTDPAYYFRPFKTMLVRTVADGGRGYYVCGRHDQTVPALWRLLREAGPNRAEG